MKAYLFAAALAALPMSAGAVTVDYDPVSGQYEQSYGVSPFALASSPLTFSYDFIADLTGVVLQIAVTGTGSLDYSVAGFGSGTLSFPGYASVDIGDVLAGSSIYLTFSNPVGSVGFTTTVYGDAAPVPLPAAGLLAIAGVAALGAVGARRRKA